MIRRSGVATKFFWGRGEGNGEIENVSKKKSENWAFEDVSGKKASVQCIFHGTDALFSDTSPFYFTGRKRSLCFDTWMASYISLISSSASCNIFPIVSSG
jgi:hypothetical protein